MSDLFHARVPLGFVRDVFAVIAETPQHTYQVLTKRSSRLPKIADKLDWPANLWMGVSVEDASALSRVDDLRAVPAAVRFLSCEPLIGPLDGLDLAGIDWLIIGGESGRGARRTDVRWVRDLLGMCEQPGVSTVPFVKQLGSVAGRELGAGPKGGDWERWPADLRFRMFPSAAGAAAAS
jgi:protein gp37